MATLFHQLLEDVLKSRREMHMALQMIDASPAVQFGYDVGNKVADYDKHCRKLVSNMIDEGLDLFIAINPAGECHVSTDETAARAWLEEFAGSAISAPRFETVKLKFD